MGCETAGEPFAEREMEGCRKAVLGCIALMVKGVGGVNGSWVCELERRKKERMELDAVRFGLGEKSGVARLEKAVFDVGVSRTLDGGGVAGVLEISGFIVWLAGGRVAEERAEWKAVSAVLGSAKPW